MNPKKIVFLTGTRADYGKLKSLITEVIKHKEFESHIFVTGMHMLSLYGSTYLEIEKDGFKNIYKFVNTKINQSMDITLSNTILGFSNYVTEFKPDLIVVHGDRVEALAGAIVGALNNIKVAHIEGGEISGTIDESIRHAITKFAHIHLVANEEARKRVIQLGEKKDSIFIIGSPDIDIMFSDGLPDFEEVRNHYEIPFTDYGILMYHPVTTEVEDLKKQISNLIEAVLSSKKNYIVIYPNNDEGSEIILKEYEKLIGNKKFRCFPSIRFESFLILLKNAQFIIGNSSAGVREACVYGIPSIDVGTRQEGRYDKFSSEFIIHSTNNLSDIQNAIQSIKEIAFSEHSPYGVGESYKQFMNVLSKEEIWLKNYQKKFMQFNM